jgi:hypothetical protein
MLKNRTTPTTLDKVRAHIDILGNEEADNLAKEGSKIDLENGMKMPTPHHTGGVEIMTTHAKAQ